jgi:hypothetical protein
MAHTNENALYPRVAITQGTSSAVSGQSLAVSGVVTASFASFKVDTKQIFFDVQTADVIVTLDGTNPVLLSRGHRLAAGTNYTWNASLAAGAKFVSTGTSSFLFLQEIAI